MGKTNKVNIAKLDVVIREEFQRYHNMVIDGSIKAINQTAVETVEYLNENSPKETGEYAKSWDYKKDDSIRGAYKYSTVVYSESPEYRLTHLLEKGHLTRNGKRTKKKPHISVAYNKAKEILRNLLIDEFVEKL